MGTQGKKGMGDNRVIEIPQCYLRADGGLLECASLLLESDTGQHQPGDERVYWSLRELREGTHIESETKQGCCLLACHPWLVHLAFLYNRRTCLRMVPLTVS